MAQGDVYQVIDAQTLLGQKCLNVFYYRQDATMLAGNIPEEIADTFDTNVVAEMLPTQSPDLTHTSIRVTNLFNPAEDFTKLVSEDGTYVDHTQTMPPFNAYAIRLVGDNGAVRSGQKRIAGVDEGAQLDGVINDTTLITALIALGAAMIAGLDIGIVGDAIAPVIVKRLLVGGQYVLPDNSGDAVLSNIVDALYNVDVSSQVSRKIGRGQ